MAVAQPMAGTGAGQPIQASTQPGQPGQPGQTLTLRDRWNRMTPRQKALCVSCCSLIVIILIFFWVRIGLMGCSCPKQFEICEDRRRLQTTGGSNDNGCSTECLCDGNFFTCEYTCPGCVSWEPFTGVILFGDEGDDPNKMPQANCCWGEDGSWGSDKEREGCSRSSKSTPRSQHGATRRAGSICGGIILVTRSTMAAQDRTGENRGLHKTTVRITHTPSPYPCI